ncbi:hypothetical protein [Chryseobacterium arthrosphaerae]|uniref:hypothetical protein n=1 Tax=Chryseobacterium arthrosphaerae TaxID=651561 RepID=UPI00241FD4F9|nr:hypothetical protein [Chryseobacterium arthrosphaerae]
MDVTAKNKTGTASSIDGILFPRVDRQRAQSLVGIPISTMIFIDDISTGSQQGSAINVASNAFYYFGINF